MGRAHMRSVGGVLTVVLVVWGLGALTMPTQADPPRILEPTVLYLQAGPIDTRDLANLAADPPDAFDPDRTYVIQLDGPMTPQRRVSLTEAGVVLLDYLPLHAYLVDLTGTSPTGVSAVAFVQWVGPFQDEWKLAPTIGQRMEPFQTVERVALEQAGKLALVVTVFPNRDVQQARRALTAMGVDVRLSYRIAGQRVFDVVVTPAMLPALAGLPFVQFIEEAGEYTLRNSTNRWIVQSNVLDVTPAYDNGIHGEGQIVGILDGRVAASHCSFFDDQGFGDNHRKIQAYNTGQGADTHGTHVAGIAVGDAFDNSNTRGIAYLGKLAYNSIPGFGESAIRSRLTLHHNQGARLHTNSWGDDGSTSYNGLCRGIDDFSYTHEESLVFFAITNTNTLKNPENAKNLVAVGASQDTPSQHRFCSGGRGPTRDGRRKPETYAPGCGTISSRGTGCGTTALTGTSMASPAVAGASMLIRQYYSDGYYPTGAPDAQNAFAPSGALIKATLLNSSVDMTGISGYPSNTEGWGRVLVDNALFFPGDSRTLAVWDKLNAAGLSTGQTDVVNFDVLSAGEQVRVTLVWTEPAGAAGADFASVNDLDLEVQSPDGTVYLGNVFSGGESVPGGSKDDRNNVEQVHVSGPMLGTWTVRIVGAGVNEGTQGYALAVTGDVSSDGGSTGNPKCEDIKKLVAKCKANGTLKGKIKLFTRDFAGRTVTFIVNDSLELPATIAGKKAKFNICCFNGQNTVGLSVPAGCDDLTQTTTCP